MFATLKTLGGERKIHHSAHEQPPTELYTPSQIPVYPLKEEVGLTYSAWFNTLTYLGLILFQMHGNNIIVITLNKTFSWNTASATEKVTNTFSVQAD